MAYRNKMDNIDLQTDKVSHEYSFKCLKWFQTYVEVHSFIIPSSMHEMVMYNK